MRTHPREAQFLRPSLPVTGRIQDARWPWKAPFGTAYYVRCYVRDKKRGPASLQALDLYGAGTRSRTRDLLITSQLLYQLSYTGVMGCEYIASDALVNPSCLIQLKKIDRWCSR
ncbi:hypothetical protein APX70_04277 [Pseudomonas syringae pv. maculicola]|uniref:Uncharacterized protein n=1 Tax=Pseudomonas syringae pv. maculicola TaxID=59511 RepID=A0A3M3ANJ7_PSEYM|nr:hypothetical protein APX70_04277 [Pseudomonas syringae pv. maculicola]